MTAPPARGNTREVELSHYAWINSLLSTLIRECGFRQKFRAGVKSAEASAEKSGVFLLDNPRPTCDRPGNASARRRPPRKGEGLVDAQYTGAKAGLRPIYDALIERVKSFGGDVEISPKKTYVSLRRRKQFGLIQASATRIDVGINLKGTSATERPEPSGSFNAMVSHRVRVASVKDVNKELEGWLRKAYEGA
jgi:predicted transport protein